MKWIISKRQADASDFVVVETFDDKKKGDNLDVAAANEAFAKHLAEDDTATYQMQPIG